MNRPYTSLFVAVYLLLLCAQTSGQGTWTQKANFGGNVKQQAVGFSIGSYGYLGLGYEAFGYATDFEKYDPATNSWSPIANFPGGARWASVGFSIGNYGYVSTGFRSSPGTFYSDLWQYDPSTDTWAAKAAFPGGGRWYGVGFSIGNKGYVGLGYSSLTGTFYSDIWEYDPVSDTWTAKAGFPGTRSFATSFTIGNKAYVVGGASLTGNCTNDVWEFDPAANTWTLKAPYPGTPCDRMVGFSINNAGYAGTGKATANGMVTTDFYQYDPVTDTWTPVTFFAGSARTFAVGFSIGNKGYLGTGNTNCPSPGCDLKDLWEYAPASVGISDEENNRSIHFYPNPFATSTVLLTDEPLHNATLIVENCFGQTVTEIKNINGNTVIFNRDNLADGLYFFRLIEENQIIATDKLLIAE